MLLLGGARKDGGAWPESTASLIGATNVLKHSAGSLTAVYFIVDRNSSHHHWRKNYRDAFFFSLRHPM